MTLQQLQLPPRLLLGITGIVGFLLIIPLVATQLSAEVHWQATDYLVGSGLLFSIFYASAVISRHVPENLRKAVLLAFAWLSFLLIWVALAT